MSLKVKKNINTLKAVDFFCGGGGMSYGLYKAGIKILAGVDFDSNCKETYEKNISEAQFIHADVFNLKEEELQHQLQLKENDDNLILIGCSPCQFWSIINTDKNKSEKSKSLLVEFKRFVEYFKPGYVIVENVPGILRKKEESGLENFITWLKNNNYYVHYDVHNISEYNVPQNRKRFTLIANRLGTNKISPLKMEGEKKTVRDVIGEVNGFKKLKPGEKDSSDPLHRVANLSDINKKRLKKVEKNGGNRLGFSKIKTLQLNCFIGKDQSFKDTFGRLWWDRPSPTITTKFFSISNGRFVHPEEDRALSLREGAVLQSFPIDYNFIGTSTGAIARLIGNAVPPEYARRIGLAIKNNHLNAI